MPQRHRSPLGAVLAAISVALLTGAPPAAGLGGGTRRALIGRGTATPLRARAAPAPAVAAAGDGADDAVFVSGTVPLDSDGQPVRARARAWHWGRAPGERCCARMRNAQRAKHAECATRAPGQVHAHEGHIVVQDDGTYL